MRELLIFTEGVGFMAIRLRMKIWLTRLAQEGYLVIVPNYRLTPDGVYPAGKQDILFALEWLRQSEYSFDRTK